jgi:hypothetical protein
MLLYHTGHGLFGAFKPCEIGTFKNYIESTTAPYFHIIVAPHHLPLEFKARTHRHPVKRRRDGDAAMIRKNAPVFCS